MKKNIFVILAAVLLLASCGTGETQKSGSAPMEAAVSPDEKFTRNFFAMDTDMDFTVYGGGEDALDAAEAEIERIEALLSKTKKTSDIYRINSGEKFLLSKETNELLSKALSVSADTDGTFDITVAPLVELWGFVDKDFKVPTDEEIEKTLASVGYSKFTVNADGSFEKPADTKIDLGGIAKGYASDRVIEVMAENGVSSAIVSLGGNVRALGRKPDGKLWKVGVQDPFSDGEASYVGVISIEDKAVITSGAYQRYFEENGKRYHHIIDPSTGAPSESGLASATVVCRDGCMGDALSTALFVMGKDKAVEFWRSRNDFDMVLIGNDGTMTITEGISDNFKSDNAYSIEKR